ncbi:MAG TPA: flippase, partial [Negativicutes bacterium]|nr:flippase [Negativicutes bacterium]
MRQVGTNFVWLLSEKVFRILFGVLIGAWVARFLGPYEYGVLSYAMAFVGIIAPLSGLGLDSIVIRELILSPDSNAEILGTSFCLRAIGGIAIALLSLAGAMIFHGHDTTMVWLIGIFGFSVFLQVIDIPDLWFQSRTQSAFVVKSHLVGLVVSAAIKVGLIVFGVASVVFFALSGVAELIVSLGVVLCYYLGSGPSIHNWRFNSRHIRNWLNESWPFMLTGILGFVMLNRVVQVLLKNVGSNFDAGIFAAALRVAEFWYYIPMYLMASAFPSVVEFCKTDSRNLTYHLRPLLHILNLISLFSVAFFAVFSDSIIQLLYGRQYEKAAEVLFWLIVCSLPVNYGFVLNVVLVVHRKTHIFFGALMMGLSVLLLS